MKNDDLISDDITTENAQSLDELTLVIEKPKRQITTANETLKKSKTKEKDETTDNVPENKQLLSYCTIN